MKVFTLSLLLLSGCVTMSAADEEAYRALGTEPFWSITIENGRMTYDSPEGGFSVPAPRGQELGDGRLWETRRITLQSSNDECSDGMSDNTYSQTVRAVVDGRTLNGCGGEVQSPPAVTSTSWYIVGIGGDTVSGENYRLDFGEGRLVAAAGCNRLSASFTEADQVVTAGPVASTRMACQGPAAAHERSLLRVLGAPMRIMAWEGGEMLVLVNEAGQIQARRN